jgi:catechol 2,3-dioxygenase-like lactoylglutathione lyase family enzyme
VFAADRLAPTRSAVLPSDVFGLRPVPEIVSVVETCLYGDDLAALETFYAMVLGLTVVDRDADRHVFFRVGDAQMLLLFHPQSTAAAGHFPPHGARGPGHAAFGIRRDERDAWRTRLEQHGVSIELDYTWPHGGQSLYFRDPAGNSLELVTPGVWGLPSGW